MVIIKTLLQLQLKTRKDRYNSVPAGPDFYYTSV